ncbi:NUDIX hydrolase [Lederbergia sp. NSJ-179]|uniref:NUDIX hydrolase n=1 Tax=Lederbergia sp. NSJ-179 TaxID=2931402 RepID=UPI001FD4841D|nr:NUDIX hydrolase [Lederbergia sp. NSJ-179]MCJ7841394.1 NUDIX hydrolase [Lederbergia sp. NSJ-179]
MSLKLSISIKGILFNHGRVLLLKNERDEWELPGGRIEEHESPEECLAREVQEELGIHCTVETIIDSWVFEVLKGKFVFIVSYLCKCDDPSNIFISEEHKEYKWVHLDGLEDIHIPKGFEACGGGKVIELFDDSERQMKRNLFCFPDNNTRCALQPTNEINVYQFSIKTYEQIDFDYIEFLFNQRDEKYIYYSNNNSIKRSLNDAFLEKDGIQYLSPEIVLLYKSTYLNSIDATKHHHDFKYSLPLLSLEQKQWLKRSLEICHSDTHEWITEL